MITSKVDLKQLHGYVNEATLAHEAWRAAGWMAAEFLDGEQWSSHNLAKLKEKGVSPLTINRVFPIINLLHGHYLNNQLDVTAKGRTKDDNELGQVMSEGIQFVVDQANGTTKMANSFKQAITTGFGCLSVGYDNDPRKEPVTIREHQWYEVWWDPFASDPFMASRQCRYAFLAKWTDLQNIKALFPGKADELESRVSSLKSDSISSTVYDQGTMVEDYVLTNSSSYWLTEDQDRIRVRPVEMWYTVFEKGLFAVMPNGRVFDLTTIGDPQAEMRLIMQSKEVVSANVKKMRVATFLADVLLQDCCTPFPHDEFPFVPYVGYTDRYGMPYGAIKQAIDQQVEVNKRRSMALSLLSARRVTTEEGAAEDNNRTYSEANRHDGFIVMRKGKMDKVRIEDMANLSTTQMDMLRASEREIQEISGANDDSLGYDSPSRSGVALEQRKQSSSTITKSLLENAKFSQKLLGDKITALIQDTWTDEKVLRITDRVTATEKFISVNERYFDGTQIAVRNDITQAKFDIVVSNRTMTDTMREKNSELIFAAINKAPPEAVPSLLNLALELSDIPNKDLLLAQIREATGVSSIDDNLTQEERDQKAEFKAQQQQEREAEDRQLTMEAASLDLEKQRAEIAKLNAEAQSSLASAQAKQQEADQKGFQIGVQASQMSRNNAKEKEYVPRGEQSEGKDNNVVPQPKEQAA